MTTSKACISIYFDNQHIQSIVIEAGYFNINLLAALTWMLIVFKCKNNVFVTNFRTNFNLNLTLI